jgi:hypothetical protein
VQYLYNVRGWYVGMCLQIIERGIGGRQHKQIQAVYFPPLIENSILFPCFKPRSIYSILSMGLGKQSFQRQEALVAVIT